jgi:tetratricopeptide (TPR) repeat protein
MTPEATPSTIPSEHSALAPWRRLGTGWWRFLPGWGRRGAPEHLLQASRCIEKQNFSQALLAYQQALEADPRCVKAHQGIALLLVRRGGRAYLQSALQHILESVQVDPYDPQNYRINALVYQRLGNRKRMAIELRCMAITHTLRKQPDHPVANNQMGVLLLRQFRADLAMGHFQRAVKALPRYEAALRNLARTCAARAETAPPQERATLLSAAARDVEQALAAAPTAAGWAALARIRLLQGQPEEALAAVEQAVQLHHPEDVLAPLRAEAQMALATSSKPAPDTSPNSPPIR